MTNNPPKTRVTPGVYTALAKKKDPVAEEKRRKGGRPKGSKNALTLLREAILEKSEKTILDHFPKIVEAVCREAEKGNVQAAKLIMDRLIPARKAVEHVRGEDSPSGGINIVIRGVETLQTTIDGEYTHETKQSRIEPTGGDEDWEPVSDEERDESPSPVVLSKSDSQQ